MLEKTATQIASARGALDFMANQPLIRVLLRGEQSNKRLGVIDERVPADFEGAPLHVHPRFDEVFYVLKGELTFQLCDELLTLASGDLVYAERGVPHTFANRSRVEARVLIVCTPAGFERYFDQLAVELTDTMPPPEASKPRPETIIVGPKIGDLEP
jgi:mannose-6-phosphate isomerase-like protein (cupin superfamily)